jgi:hypothetical protein
MPTGKSANSMCGRSQWEPGVPPRWTGETPILHKIKTRVTIDFSRNFHKRATGGDQTLRTTIRANRSANRNALSPVSTAHRDLCTISGHPLVDRLHSIACKRDKSGHFLLTIKIEGVKTTSFFDTF